MTVATDEATMRQSSSHQGARGHLAKGVAKPGVLQISTLSPVDEKLVPPRRRSTKGGRHLRSTN